MVVPPSLAEEVEEAHQDSGTAHAGVQKVYQVDFRHTIRPDWARFPDSTLLAPCVTITTTKRSANEQQ